MVRWISSAPVHELKCEPEPFEAILDGRKFAEFRLDDRGFGLGHHLILQEWLPASGEFSGRSIRVVVVDLRRGPDFGIPHGYVMMSILPAGSGAYVGGPHRRVGQHTFVAFWHLVSAAEALAAGRPHVGLGRLVRVKEEVQQAIRVLERAGGGAGGSR